MEFKIGFDRQPRCCSNCWNNPAINPHASGACACVLPYLEMNGTTSGRTTTHTANTWTTTITVGTGSYGAI